MSTLEEMGRDLERAIELEDHEAALGIALEMDREAASLGFEETGQELISAMQLGNHTSALGIARWLGNKGGRIDLERSHAFGTHLAKALGYKDVGLAVQGRAN